MKSPRRDSRTQKEEKAGGDVDQRDEMTSLQAKIKALEEENAVLKLKRKIEALEEENARLRQSSPRKKKKAKGEPSGGTTPTPKKPAVAKSTSIWSSAKICAATPIHADSMHGGPSHTIIQQLCRSVGVKETLIHEKKSSKREKPIRTTASNNWSEACCVERAKKSNPASAKAAKSNPAAVKANKSESKKCSNNTSSIKVTKAIKRKGQRAASGSAPPSSTDAQSRARAAAGYVHPILDAPNGKGTGTTGELDEKREENDANDKTKRKARCIEKPVECGCVGYAFRKEFDAGWFDGVVSEIRLRAGEYACTVCPFPGFKS